MGLFGNWLMANKLLFYCNRDSGCCSNGCHCSKLIDELGNQYDFETGLASEEYAALNSKKPRLMSPTLFYLQFDVVNKVVSGKFDYGSIIQTLTELGWI